MNNISFAGKLPVQSVTEEVAKRYVGKAPMGEAVEAAKKVAIAAEEKAAQALANEYAAVHGPTQKVADSLSADKLAEAYRAAHGIIQK